MQTAAGTGLPQSSAAGTASLTLAEYSECGKFSLGVSTAASANSDAATTGTSAESTHVMHTGGLGVAAAVLERMSMS
jgi:hypothetical protein